MPPTQASNTGSHVSWGPRNFLNPFLYVRKVRILFSAPFLNIYWEKEIATNDVSDAIGECFKRQVSGLL